MFVLKQTSIRKLKKKKIKQKIRFAILLMIVLMNILHASFAFDIGAKELVSLGECEKLMTYNGTPIRTTYIAY